MQKKIYEYLRKYRVALLVPGDSVFSKGERGWVYCHAPIKRGVAGLPQEIRQF